MISKSEASCEFVPRAGAEIRSREPLPCLALDVERERERVTHTQRGGIRGRRNLVIADTRHNRSRGAAWARRVPRFLQPGATATRRRPV